MIRKFARFVEPAELVRDLFMDVGAWPHWFPGIRTVSAVEGSRDRPVFDVTQHSFGREWTQRLEIRPTPSGFEQRQLQGRLKRWDLVWKFEPPPEGLGTTLSLEIDFDLGIVGRLTPARVIQRGLDQLFQDVVQNGRDRLRELAAAAPGDPEGAALMTVFSTPSGLEIQLEGRRYRLLPID